MIRNNASGPNCNAEVNCPQPSLTLRLVSDAQASSSTAQECVQNGSSGQQMLELFVYAIEISGPFWMNIQLLIC